MITASILFFYQPIENFLSHFFPKRPLEQVDWIDRYALWLLGVLRPLFALNLAVQLSAIPLTLFFFQETPVLGLIYNLFFPLFISLSLFLFLFATLLFPIPLISIPIHQFNHWYTKIILSFTDSLPISFHYNIETPAIPLTLLIIYFCLLFFTGTLIQERKEQLPYL